MDDLGSVLKVVDSSGTVKNSYYYDPYGLSLNKSETVANPWQYASGYFDATTGLYKFGTRYYDPQTGRWTQKDPVGGSVGKIGSGNPYVYAGDEPTMQTDPSGRDSVNQDLQIACLAVFGGTILGGVGGGYVTIGAVIALISAETKAAALAALYNIVGGLVLGISAVLLTIGAYYTCSFAGVFK